MALAADEAVGTCIVDSGTFETASCDENTTFAACYEFSDPLFTAADLNCTEMVTSLQDGNSTGACCHLARTTAAYVTYNTTWDDCQAAGCLWQAGADNETAACPDCLNSTDCNATVVGGGCLTAACQDFTCVCTEYPVAEESSPSSSSSAVADPISETVLIVLLILFAVCVVGVLVAMVLTRRERQYAETVKPNAPLPYGATTQGQFYQDEAYAYTTEQEGMYYRAAQAQAQAPMGGIIVTSLGTQVYNPNAPSSKYE